ncbi:MAG: hypothetical protein PVJ52_03735 [Candidatus Woesebacteria bacterium]|jgi:hypothetical protein
MKFPKLKLIERKKKLPEWQVGFIQALAISAYVGSVSYFMNNVSKFFIGKQNQPIVIGTIMMLIFSVSALICGLLSLAYPVQLALKGKTQKALRIIAWTALFLMGIIGVFIICLLITS